MRPLLEGLLHDHLDARDEASHRIADLVDSLLANLPCTLDGPGGSCRGRLLDIEANLLGAPLATRLKSRTRAASSLGSEPCVFTRRRNSSWSRSIVFVVRGRREMRTRLRRGDLREPDV